MVVCGIPQEDMTALHHLHEPGILANLEQRSSSLNLQPYSRVSNVLVAVNPLQRVPQPTIDMYQSPSLDMCPPHPYAVAEMAYRQLMLHFGKPGQGNTNQSIVISGESGAG